jgi:hypothetical protein
VKNISYDHLFSPEILDEGSSDSGEDANGSDDDEDDNDGEKEGEEGGDGMHTTSY